MKSTVTKIITIMVLASIGILACERELESEGIQVGTIRFPSIIVFGNNPDVLETGTGSYDDPGAQALLGEDDITGEMDVDGAVDLTTPDLYTLQYSVRTVNELGDESESNEERLVLVTCDDLSDFDVSGTYVRNNDPSTFISFPIVKEQTGVFLVRNPFGSSTTFDLRFYTPCEDELIIPITNSQFGRLMGTGTISGDVISYALEFLDPPNTGFVFNLTFTKQ